MIGDDASQQSKKRMASHELVWRVWSALRAPEFLRPSSLVAGTRCELLAAGCWCTQRGASRRDPVQYRLPIMPGTAGSAQDPSKAQTPKLKGVLSVPFRRRGSNAGCEACQHISILRYETSKNAHSPTLTNTQPLNNGTFWPQWKSVALPHKCRWSGACFVVSADSARTVQSIFCRAAIQVDMLLCFTCKKGSRYQWC